jgi:hypothetical protein
LLKLSDVNASTPQGISRHWDSQLCLSYRTLSGRSSGTVEAGEFPDCGFAAGFQAGDFTEPAVEFGFFDAFGEVRDDFDDAFPLFGVDSQHGASDAGMFVLAWGAIGSAAGAQFEFAFMEVLAELDPFLFGWFPVFGFRSDASSFVDVCL